MKHRCLGSVAVTPSHQQSRNSTGTHVSPVASPCQSQQPDSQQMQQQHWRGLGPFSLSFACVSSCCWFASEIFCATTNVSSASSNTSTLYTKLPGGADLLLAPLCIGNPIVADSCSNGLSRSICGGNIASSVATRCVRVDALGGNAGASGIAVNPPGAEGMWPESPIEGAFEVVPLNATAAKEMCRLFASSIISGEEAEVRRWLGGRWLRADDRSAEEPEGEWKPPAPSDASDTRRSKLWSLKELVVDMCAWLPPTLGGGRLLCRKSSKSMPSWASTSGSDHGPMSSIKLPWLFPPSHTGILSMSTHLRRPSK
mmetsp:Transcript_10482/g.18329  ORF Transcript_10482/g.18329 Transcript_10482/m.18329 type:complete len:313 (+) Transcript_10482:516-1454(+)